MHICALSHAALDLHGDLSGGSTLPRARHPLQSALSVSFLSRLIHPHLSVIEQLGWLFVRNISPLSSPQRTKADHSVPKRTIQLNVFQSSHSWIISWSRFIERVADIPPKLQQVCCHTATTTASRGSVHEVLPGAFKEPSAWRPLLSRRSFFTGLRRYRRHESYESVVLDRY